jgi:NAD(P)-dependent dehydrogenase (short-subunit alcohol dehydrogenase family)
VKAIIFGASGGLAQALGLRLLNAGWQVDFVTRLINERKVKSHFETFTHFGQARVFTITSRYSDFDITESYDAHFMTQALFNPGPFYSLSKADIEAEVTIGLTDLILITRNILKKTPPGLKQRQDFCFIGSTLAYAVSRNASIYCVVKHGLVGFIRAMNHEYAETAARFWLCSMGPMKTEMGVSAANATDQDVSSYLDPLDVADRIISTISSNSNIFEPEIIMRRRSTRIF